MNQQFLEQMPYEVPSGPVSPVDASWTLIGAGTDGSNDAQKIPISAPFPFSVGRQPGCSGQINNRTVSSLHAELSVRDGELWLVDRQSTNGTYVNGKRVEAPIRIQSQDIVQFAEVAYRVSCDAAMSTCRTINEDVCDQALALAQFDRMMGERLVQPAFQPIVEIASGKLRGFEVLARSQLYGLETAQLMFDAAARMNMEVELSRLMRNEGLQQAALFEAGTTFFVNTHPLELEREGLIHSLAELRASMPNVPIVLEVHEAAISDPSQMKGLREKLREISIGLAYDDFGAGQARLSELAEAPPDYLKFDISLVRGLHGAASGRRNMLASLVKMVHDLGVVSLAEGIETAEDAAACHEIGFTTAQGYYYGRPKALSDYIQ